LKVVFDQIKRYIALQGHTPIQRFREQDFENDGTLDKEQFKVALIKMGFEKVDEE